MANTNPQDQAAPASPAQAGSLSGSIWNRQSARGRLIQPASRDVSCIDAPIARLMPMPRQHRPGILAGASRGCLLAAVLCLAAPSGASALSEQLQSTAQRCFTGPALPKIGRAHV